MSRLIVENPQVQTLEEAIEITAKTLPAHLQLGSQYTIWCACRKCKTTTHIDKQTKTMPIHFPENAKGAQHIQSLMSHRTVENDDTIVCNSCGSFLSVCYSSRPPKPYTIFELYPYVTGGKQMRTDLIFNGGSLVVVCVK
eukprot:Tbor_TRINITY_DN5957_c0_g1::TRINITY_DN5957_c0_g1_i2::g.19310::m.19310